MAKSSFRFIRFDWNRNGYNAFKASRGVMSMLASSASRIQAAAEAMSGKDYTSNVVRATKNRNIGSVAQVSTANDSAVRENWKNNTLLKSIDAGRL